MTSTADSSRRAGSPPPAGTAAGTPPAGSNGAADPNPAPGSARPTKSRRGPGRPSKQSKRDVRAAKLVSDLTGLGVMLLVINPRDGAAVTRHAENIANALADLAEHHPIVGKLLDGAAAGGAWFGVAAAAAPLVVELAANHGLLGPLSTQYRTRLPTDDIGDTVLGAV